MAQNKERPEMIEIDKYAFEIVEKEEKYVNQLCRLSEELNVPWIVDNNTEEMILCMAKMHVQQLVIFHQKTILPLMHKAKENVEDFCILFSDIFLQNESLFMLYRDYVNRFEELVGNLKDQYQFNSGLINPSQLFDSGELMRLLELPMRHIFCYQNHFEILISLPLLKSHKYKLEQANLTLNRIEQTLNFMSSKYRMQRKLIALQQSFGKEFNIFHSSRSLIKEGFVVIVQDNLITQKYCHLFNDFLVLSEVEGSKFIHARRFNLFSTTISSILLSKRLSSIVTFQNTVYLENQGFSIIEEEKENKIDIYFSSILVKEAWEQSITAAISDDEMKIVKETKKIVKSGELKYKFNDNNEWSLGLCEISSDECPRILIYDEKNGKKHLKNFVSLSNCCAEYVFSEVTRDFLFNVEDFSKEILITFCCTDDWNRFQWVKEINSTCLTVQNALKWTRNQPNLSKPVLFNSTNDGRIVITRSFLLSERCYSCMLKKALEIYQEWIIQEELECLLLKVPITSQKISFFVLFRILHQLEVIHEHLMMTLETSSSQNTSREPQVGLCFKSITDLLQVYRLFMLHYRKCVSEIFSFDERVKNRSNLCQGLQIILSQVHVRISAYIITLRRLEKITLENHVSFVSLKEAIQDINSIKKEIHLDKEKQINTERLIALNDILRDAPHVDVQNQKLYRAGLLVEVRQKRNFQFYAFLLSDQFIYGVASETQNDLGIPNTFKIRGRFSLRNCSVHEVDRVTGFEIRSNKFVVAFLCTNFAERKLWITDLKNCLKDLANNITCSPLSSCLQVLPSMASSCGWLDVYDSIQSKWQTRWVLLKERRIYFYYSINDNEPFALLDLTDWRIEEAFNTWNSHRFALKLFKVKNKLSFDLKQSKSNYVPIEDVLVLSAIEEIDAKCWFSMISETIKDYSLKLKSNEDYNRDSFAIAPEWIPDHISKECSVCFSSFTLFIRRHHCRLCGKVVCAKCSMKSTKNQFSSKPKYVRCCDSCSSSTTIGFGIYNRAQRSISYEIINAL